MNTYVTLNEGQGHSNWYEIIQFCYVHHHTAFEKNEAVKHLNVSQCLNSLEFVCLLFFIIKKKSSELTSLPWILI